MKIEDNFLDQEKFDGLQALMMDVDFAWFYNPYIDHEEDIDKFQFTHMFYEEAAPRSSFIKQINSILDRIKVIILVRIKANLLTRTSNIIQNAFHVDMKPMPEEKQKQWTTSIFYINNNNGYTKFEDGTKVESVANRMVTFPANTKHTGTSCTDEKIRVVINFNYFSEQFCE